MTIKRSKQTGQGMTEYIIMVALIGIAAAGVFLLFGWTARPQQAAIAMELSGLDGSASLLEAQMSARGAVEYANENKGLDNYMVRAVTAGP